MQAQAWAQSPWLLSPGAVKKRDGVRPIGATLYELEGEILDTLAATMRECECHCSDAEKPVLKCWMELN
jgi:hypothetical protein